MAVRRRVVRPDTVIDTPEGQIAYVSDDGYLQALMAVGQTQCVAGGVLSAVIDRYPTGIEGEMVTVSAVIEWKDRTDGKPQPERSASADSVTHVHDDQPGLFDATVDEDEIEALDEPLSEDEEAAVSEDDLGEEVDESAVPEALRG